MTALSFQKGRDIRQEWLIMKLYHQTKFDCKRIINSEDIVETAIFMKLNIRNVIGPDNICGRLWNCVPPSFLLYSVSCLCGLWKKTLPFTWKTSVICHVPKKLKPNPSSLNVYRLIALTSVVMMCSECISLHQPMKHIKPHLDPYQFA